MTLVRILVQATTWLCLASYATAALAQATPPVGHSHTWPGSSDDGEPQIVWITIGEDLFGELRKRPDILGSAAKSHAAANGAVITRVDAAKLGDLSTFVHSKVARCPGFMVHKSQEDAVAALRAAGLPALKNLPIELEIDQQATVGSLLPTVSESNVLATITQLSTAYDNRYFLHPSGVQSAEWIRDQWQGYAGARLGVDVDVETVAHDGYPQPSVMLTVTGASKPDEIVVLGGHLDSIHSNGTGTGTIAPGADDNASGIAALSEAIRVLMSSGHTPARTLKFIGYAAEEVGLFGSGDIARDHAAAGANVIGVMQLDMTAYNGSVNDVTLIDDYTHPALNAFIGELLDQYQPALLWSYRSCGYACSDHASWTRHGYPAAMPHEANPGQSNPTIHSSADTLATLGNTAAHAVKFARLAVSFAVEAGTGGGDGSPPPPAPLLENGEPELLDATTGEELVFMVDIPAGATDLVFTTTGSGGDADLYIDFNCVPTQDHFQCRSAGPSSNESCTIDPAREGLYYAMVHAYSGFSDLSLEVTYTPPVLLLFADGFETGDLSQWSVP